MIQKTILGKANFQYNGQVVSIKIHKGACIEDTDAIDIIATSSAISNEDIHCLLIDIREMKFISSEARNILAIQSKKNIPAIAIIINSFLQKSLASLYLKISNPKIVTKVFIDEYEAIDWLLNIYNKNN